ncbi:MAG: tetratricopeptide repeat protein [Dehalococcoidia bacterium]|nr:MAG: tetratricopeptide repeat protein [Dehalococcoidia bacterium]
MQSNISPESWPIKLLFPLFLILIGASYCHTLYSPLTLDDFASFVEVREVYINEVSLEALRQIAESRFGLARFLPMLSFAIDHRLSGGGIVQFHITNIAIHLLATLALYAFLSGLMRFDACRLAIRMMSPAHFCLFVAVLWATHPVQTNAVTYIVQRMAAMMTMFYLATLACYLYARVIKIGAKSGVLYTAAGIFAIAALLCKENAATLPLAILLLEAIFISPQIGLRLQRAITRRRALVTALLLLLLAPLAAGSLERYVMAGYEIRHFTLLERILTELRVVVSYLSLLALPLPNRLNLDHDFSLSSSLLSPPTTLFSLLFLLAMLLTGIRTRRQEPLVAFAIFWFFLQLIIESSVVPLELVFEHRLYLPSIGFVLVVVTTIDRVFAYLGRHNLQRPHQVAFLCLVILTCVLSLLTSVRNYTWRDPLSIYGDSLRKSPVKPRAMVNYGTALIRADRLDEALPLMEQAIALGRPGEEEYVNAANNILAVLVREKEYAQSIEKGESYLTHMPPNVNGSGFAKFMFNLGYSYFNLGRYEEALGAYVRGLAQENASEQLFLTAMRSTYEAALSKGSNEELEEIDREVAVLLKMAALMMQLKHYDHCRSFLDEVIAADSANQKMRTIEEQLQSELIANENATRSADITQDADYQQNIRFRWTMRAATFLLRHYAPLRPLAGKLLTFAQQMEPANPFAAAMIIEYFLARDDSSAAMATAEQAIRQHESFPPLLDLIGNGYLARGDHQRAAIVFSQLLAIYPGHPRWRDYDTVIRKNLSQLPASEDSPNLSPPTSQS